MLDKLDNMKNSLNNAEGQVDAFKAKGQAFKEKVLSLGLGGAAIAVLGFLAEIQFEWWSVAVIAFAVGFIMGKTPAQSFAYGTAAVTFLWTAYAGYLTISNKNLMSDTIGKMFGGYLTGGQLAFATGLIGGLVGGFATMSGAMLRGLFSKQEA